MIYFLTAFLSGVLEKFAFFQGSRHNNNVTAMMFLSSGVQLGFQILFKGGFSFSFISDPLFYVVFILENFVVWLVLKNFKVQNTYAEVSFILFNSIWLVAFFTLFYNYTGIISVTPAITQKNLFPFTAALVLVSLFYFRGHKIKSPLLLFSYLVFLSNLAVLSLYLLKKHNDEGFLIYSAIYFSIGVQYLIHSRGGFSLKNINIPGVISYCLTFAAALFSIKHLPITSFIFLKRMGQYNTGVFLDGKRNKKDAFVNFVLLLIFITFILF